MASLITSTLRPTTIEPRPYQLESIHKVFDRFRAGDRSTLVVQPTGTGKTVTGGAMIRMGAERGRRALWLANRTDLVTQTINHLERHGLDPQREQADSYAREMIDEPDVVVGTVQSLQGSRLAMWPRDYFNLIVADECITGDTVVVTDVGEIPIGSIPSSGCRKVLSFDGSRVVWRDITAFMPKGTREIIEIDFASGRSIRCTANHPIFTDKGWIQAGELREGSLALSLASAVAEPCSARISGGGRGGSFSGTRGPQVSAQIRSGGNPTKNSSRTRRSASAAAARRYSRPSATSNRTFAVAADGVTTDSPTCTTRGRQIGNSSLLKRSGRRSSGLYLGIPVSSTRTPGARIRGFPATTAVLRRTGQSTRLPCSAGSILSSASGRTQGTARSSFKWRPDACRASFRSRKSPIVRARSGSPASGSTGSARSDWRGGSATTVLLTGTVSTSALTDSPGRRSNSRPSGSATITGRRPSTRVKVIPSSTSPQTPGGISSHSSSLTSPSRCSTNFDRVVSVRSAGSKPVFDISVNETHCFFANGILVHNCHHFASDTYQIPLKYFNTAKIVGLTATPEAPGGKNLGAVFDSVADERDIFWAWSDPLGPYLCPLNVVRRDIGFDLSDLRVDNASDYSADDLADLLTPLVEPIANVVLDEVMERQTLIYVPRVCVAQAVATALTSLGMSAEWIAGNDPDRDSKLKAFSRGDLQVLVNADLLGEGNDIPNVSCIVDAYPTRSTSRFIQRVGRGLRPDTPDCLLICLASNSKDHKLVTPADLIPQARFNDSVADWIDALLEQKSEAGEKPSLMDAVEQARERARDDIPPPRVIRCRARRYQVAGRRVVLNASHAAEVLGCPSEFRLAKPTVRMAKHMALSDKQKAILSNSGVLDVDRLSKRQASVLIGKLFDRREEGLASLKMVRFMISKGVDPAVAREMSFGEAKETLDRLVGKK